MKSVLVIVFLLFFGISVYAGDCEVVDYSTYQKVRGSVMGGEGSIGTVWCASFTIKNTSGGGRFGPTIKATSVDGKIKERKIKTPRLDAGETYSDAKCFGSKPISSLSCSF